MLDSISRLERKYDGAKSMVRLKHVIGVTLQWRDLTYVVQAGRGRKRKAKTVLQGISGHVTPGHLLAVMGPTGAGWRAVLGRGAWRAPGVPHDSTARLLPGCVFITACSPACPAGSGKTSLLNALAGRLSMGGKLEGEVRGGQADACWRLQCLIHSSMQRPATGIPQAAVVPSPHPTPPHPSHPDTQVLVNGAPRSRGFRSIAAYVLQDDVLFANLTVGPHACCIRALPACCAATPRPVSTCGAATCPAARHVPALAPPLP